MRAQVRARDRGENEGLYDARGRVLYEQDLIVDEKSDPLRDFFKNLLGCRFQITWVRSCSWRQWWWWR